MKNFVILILLFNCVTGSGQYLIDDIPEKLTKGADAVYLLDQGEFTVTNDDRAVFKVKERIAILNGEGGKFAVKRLWYDKLRKIKYLNAERLDRFGQSIKKLKKADISDVSAISGFSIYEDNRVKIADLRQVEYPYIVEFEYEIEYKYLYHIPNWYLLPDDEVGVVRSVFTLTSPKDYVPRFKVENIEDRSVRSESDGLVNIRFEYQNLPPMIFESYQPRNVLPYILTSPSNFKFEDYTGNLSTWESFGQWQNSLNQGLNDLPVETALHMKTLVKSYTSFEDKARAIYEYVQENTRYVSIQLGIGGWQPFANSVVDESGYGDCKALSFYTQSLLKSVGIKSHYTIVFGGRDGAPPLDRDFAANQFNHVILCVPNAGDTLWLECTSQTNPFGYAGKFTGNRDVLLVTEDGGKLARTPYYSPEINTQHTVAQIEVDDDLNSSASISISYAGLQYENRNLNTIVNQGKDEQLNWVEKYFTVPGFQLSDFNLKNNREIIPSIELNVEFESSKLFNKVGDRYFIQPNLFNRNTYVPERDSDRKFDISVGMGYVDSDTLIFKMPERLRPEFLPEPKNIDSEFGTYSTNVSYENGTLIYVRNIMVKDGTFDKEKYDAFRNFKRAVVRADKLKIAFLKRT